MRGSLGAGLVLGCQNEATNMVPKGHRKVAKRELNAAKMEPKGTKSAPMGDQQKQKTEMFRKGLQDTQPDSEQRPRIVFFLDLC